LSNCELLPSSGHTVEGTGAQLNAMARIPKDFLCKKWLLAAKL